MGGEIKGRLAEWRLEWKWEIYATSIGRAGKIKAFDFVIRGSKYVDFHSSTTC